jgi:hypothetical protein
VRSVGILGYLAVLAAIAAAPELLRRWRLRPVLDTFRSLGIEPRRVGNAALATVRGIDVSYELRPGERAGPDLTVCSARLPADVEGLEIDLRPQTASEARHVERGRAVDLQLEDPSFDERFVIEAAPAQTTRELLDPPTRAALGAVFPCRILYAGNGVRLEKWDLVRRPADVRRVLDAVLALSVRVVALAERGEPGPVDPNVASDVSLLHQARTRRSRFHIRQRIALLVMGALVGLALYWLKTRDPR